MILVQILLNVINEWFSEKDIRFMEKNGAIKYITHLDKFSYFRKHYNFHEIMYSQYSSKNFQVEMCSLKQLENILTR